MEIIKTDIEGVLVIERTPDSDEDEMMMTVLDAGAEDMQTMDDAIYDLFMRRVISPEEAVTYAQDPVAMNKKVNFDF